jgi:hypothetical protein
LLAKFFASKNDFLAAHEGIRMGKGGKKKDEVKRMLGCPRCGSE